MISSIKIIAFIFMIVDHIGYFFYPDIIFLRVLGRISMPLFAYSISEGIIYTKDIKKYLKRLFLFAILSQIPYTILFGFRLNIIFSFLFAATLIMLKEKYNNKYIYILLLLIILFNLEYSFCAICLVIIFHEFRNRKVKLFINLFIVMFLYSLSINVYYQMISLISLIIILFFNKRVKVPAAPARIFYYLYPIHFLIIIIIRVL